MILTASAYSDRNYQPTMIDIANLPVAQLRIMAEAMFNAAVEGRAEQHARDYAQTALSLITAMRDHGVSSCVTDDESLNELEMIAALAPVGW